MTRWQAFIIFFCLIQAAAGQNHGCLGIELTDAVRSGNARIRIGYSLSQHWSAEAVSSFHICTCGKNIEDRSPSMELSFRHWVRESYKGNYLSFGIYSGFKRKTDIKFSLGYALPIWECIGMDIGYGFKLLDTIRQKKPASGEITLEIHYLF